MAHTPHDDPQKVLLVPESLYDATSAYVDHLRRNSLQTAGMPGGGDGATGPSDAESSENHPSGRSTPRGWSPMTPPNRPTTGTPNAGTLSASETADYDEELEPEGADEPAGNAG